MTKSTAEMNAEANAFARALLMPDFLLRPEIARMGGIDVDDEVAIAKLAKKFRVSPAQMILRIGELLSDLPNLRDPECDMWAEYNRER